MFIVTTYVMCEDVIDLIENAEEKTKLPKEMLLMFTMHRMMKDYRSYIREEGRIEYQKRFDEKTGEPIVKHRVKMKVNQCDYDYFQDMRKFFRKSILLVMAIAVFRYLNEIVDKILNKKIGVVIEDSYPLQNYAILGKCIDNIPTWRIWWGIPTNLELLLT